MKNGQQIRNVNYEAASKLLSKLAESDSDEEQLINSCIQKNGIMKFFEHLDSFEFSTSTVEKLQAVKDILFSIEGGDANA